MAEKSGNVVKEEVLKEFPPFGKYRVRLLRNPRTKKMALDIREWISGESFEGFTRRGIRIYDRAEAQLLREVLKDLLDGKGITLT